MGGATGGTTPTTAAGSAASPQAKDETSEQRGTDRHIFMDKLRKYHENRGMRSQCGRRECATVFGRDMFWIGPDNEKNCLSLSIRDSSEQDPYPGPEGPRPVQTVSPGTGERGNGVCDSGDEMALHLPPAGDSPQHQRLPRPQTGIQEVSLETN